jgi:hypothetical protein
METAVNIGYACSLLHDSMRQFRLSGSLPEVEKLEAAGKLKEAHVLGAEMVEEQLHSVGGAGGAPALQSAFWADLLRVSLAWAGAGWCGQGAVEPGRGGWGGGGFAGKALVVVVRVARSRAHSCSKALGTPGPVQS